MDSGIKKRHMARFNRAKWRPLPENRTEPFIKATQFFFHSIVGSAEGAYGYFLNYTNLESHFISKKTKVNNYTGLYQLIDTARQADAQYRANIRGISVETEDNGRPDSDPLNKRQVEDLIDLGRWAAKTHSIPKRVAPRWDAPGFGWHAMFGAPSQLTPVRGKTCPGKIRIRQLKNIILPAIFTGKDVDQVDAADRRAIAKDVAERLKNDAEFLRKVGHANLYDTRFNLYEYWDNREEPESVNLATGVARAAQAADEARDIVKSVNDMVQRIEQKIQGE